MAQETVRLADYAAALRFEDLPAEVVECAKAGIADTVAAAICGSVLPWSRIVAGYAERTGPGGKSRIFGGPAVQPPAAALANGALAHAFELDSLTRPGAGVHPGAALLPAALAVAQQEGAGGRALIAAFVAGCEAMVRIGRATGHTNEARGFHAPGTTGPFGAAVAAGHIIGLAMPAMAHALGIAGSLAGGLLEFARAGDGGMVKRLHLGRACEGGVLAASLARDGFAGPSTVLEGEFGFLRVFCTEWDVAELTRGLGEEFATLTLCLKRYPCHINAHAPVRAVWDLRREHGFEPAAVTAITVRASERAVARHNIPEPPDLMLAQYSMPFCTALALYRDPHNPESFDEAALRDPAILALSRRVRLEPTSAGHGSWGSTVAIELADGRRLHRQIEDATLAPSDLPDKFERLTRGVLGPGWEPLFARLQRLEQEDRLDWLG
ncbi:MAG: MmgE/PrpD family protein [Alphaproteobacteria bacterium]|nr:MmgE/PrpD family protein [Alphaproteobacteria bacterium]